MAYLRDLTDKCVSPGCNSTAVFELVSNFNAPCGKYCKRHSKAELARRNAMERADAKELEKRGLMRVGFSL